MSLDLEALKRSEIVNFIGEVFYGELKFIIGEDASKEFWVKNHGMNSRAFSKDIIDLTSFSYATEDDIKEAIFIHLSRNSIYHQLPEIFFHPLVISNSSMSNKEVVSAIKENRKLEEENIHFFIPFDTEYFNSHIALTNRYLNIFGGEDASKNLFSLARKIIDRNIHLSREQFYKLFLNLCDAERLKENLEALKELLLSIMGFTVLLEYKEKTHLETPFDTLGEGVLGFTLGMQGPVISEFDDISVTMITEQQLPHKMIVEKKQVIEMILEFFVFSNREIHIKYQTSADNGITLGENYLGYNTVLLAS